MAQVESLGIHTPAALPYLIREGILPAEPRRDLYQWHVYVAGDAHAAVEEEVLATKDCVVWSRGPFVRNVYRFELEGEDVTQAFLTNFETKDSCDGLDASRAATLNGGRLSQIARTEISNSPGSPRKVQARRDQAGLARALVVILKTKAHVYYLRGTSHIIDLPFEVEEAFPAIQGCILRRKAGLSIDLPPTPQVPAAPPNSFFSPQIRPKPSILLSPSLRRSHGASQPSRPSPLGAGDKLEGLFQDLLGPQTNAPGDEEPPLYSLYDPLAGIGVLTYSRQHHKPRRFNKGQPGLSVDFETLDPAERVVYVSAEDELGEESDGNRHPLMLLVTFNSDLLTFTVWHAWRIEEKSLQDLLNQRTAQKAAKARRRSSFLSGTLATGATTPAVRTRDHPRESFAGPGTLRVPSETHPAAPISRKPTKQEEEAVMASQMDPDYQPAASQQTNTRESRRISSLNTDLRASQGVGAASFGGTGGRRHTSFGVPNDRRSFGHRKARESTPGSTFSRSLGPEDDLMDVDSTDGGDGEESIDTVLRHIRATHEAAGVDSVFGSVDEGFKRELVVRKMHSMDVTLRSSISQPPTSKDFQVATLQNFASSPATEDRSISVYICNQLNADVTCLDVKVKLRTLWQGVKRSTKVPIPVVIDVDVPVTAGTNLIKLRDGSERAVLLDDQGIFRSDSLDVCPLPSKAAYRVRDPFSNGEGDSEMGKNRTLTPPRLHALKNAGVNGTYDEIDNTGIHHRRRLRLKPEDPLVERVLMVCQVTLPTKQSGLVSRLWTIASARLAGQQELARRTSVGREWVALTTTVLCFAINLIDAKARAAQRVAIVAASDGATNDCACFGGRRVGYRLLTTSAWDWSLASQKSSRRKSGSPNNAVNREKDQLLPIATGLADELWTSEGVKVPISVSTVVQLMEGLHIFREEQKLSLLSDCGQLKTLAVIIAQLGTWIGLPQWSPKAGSYLHLEAADEAAWEFVRCTPRFPASTGLMPEPVGVLRWFEQTLQSHLAQRYPMLSTVASSSSQGPLTASFVKKANGLTPRICALSHLISETDGLSTSFTAIVELMAKHGVHQDMLETLPASIAAPLRAAIAACGKEPPTSWPDSLLQLVGRNDTVIPLRETAGHTALHTNSTNVTVHDVHSVCHALDNTAHALKSREAGRHGVSQLIFSHDRRLVEATSLLRFYTTQEAECAKQPDWSDAHHFDQQRHVIEFVTVRMWSLPAGDGMLHYDCQTPLLTEKYTPYGFGSKCLMQPMGITLNIDRSTMSEEKVGWAYFHAGVSSGLRISRKVRGIDTSWVAFNKPIELTNRHAGLLLALGLGGHLRSLAKWLSFKYLTPKHPMTSVGLLLGLAASYIGTMDSLTTRMLSVHITRMLPPGAAELNVNAITQTAGLMGIGLLYYNTQHRRMSEIMLSEIEYTEAEDPDSGPDPLRDESYRLSAGFALGLINLGKGKALRGLHGMHLPERLLAIAIGPRPVHAVHVFDRATAGAVIALALIYMKSGDKAIASKIDIPDTEAQYDHVRPDMLLLRAMAKHVIMWPSVDVHKQQAGGRGWIEANLPAYYVGALKALATKKTKQSLHTADVPFYNILTGLAWAVGLKYAGSGDTTARDEILSALDMFYMVGGEAYYYDAKLARSTVRRCIDVLALAAATVMAGTGDLQTLRYLRRLHGRTDAETPYGSHMAAHLALGVLFMGGGTYTFGTSDLAIAMLICAFYPLFPSDVHDNRVHLQAFRHFWVFAAEARCLVIEDIDTQKPIKMPLVITLKDGSTKHLSAPCLLPELDTVATVQTANPAYWRVTLDFAGNPKHLANFRNSQVVRVRRCPASEAHTSIFSATFAALSDSQITADALWETVFSVPALRELDKADIELILPPDLHSSIYMDERGTAVDDRLVLANAVYSNDRDKLWNLRILFAWAERAQEEGEEKMKWVGAEIVQAIKSKIEARRREAASAET